MRWRTVDGINSDAERAFASLEAVFALNGEPITRDPLSEVVRVSIGEQRYYVKRYWAAGKGVRRFIGCLGHPGSTRHSRYGCHG